jgi:hypothetical protein
MEVQDQTLSFHFHRLTSWFDIARHQFMFFLREASYSLRGTHTRLLKEVVKHAGLAGYVQEAI